MAFVNSYSLSHRFSDDNAPSGYSSYQEIVHQSNADSATTLSREFYCFALACGFAPQSVVNAFLELAEEYGNAHCSLKGIYNGGKEKVTMAQVIRGGEQFETHIQADHRGQIVKQVPDSGAVDAFGRARVSEPFTVFDSVLRYDKGTEQWNEIIVGSGTCTHLSNESAVALTVTASGGSVLRRSKRRMPYQPGKSLQLMQSFVGNEPTAGLIQEVGYFDNNDGIMVRASGTTLQFVIRSSTAGTVAENVVDQDEWNIDSFPLLDFSKAQIFTCDMEWGRVRCGFVIDGEVHYCHEFNHANNIDSVYMKTAVLPLSYRIAASGNVQGTLKEICASVASEAGYEPDGPIYTAGRGASSFEAISSETLVAAIRMGQWSY